MSDDMRQKFTDNAKEFDSLMVAMLAENKRLRALVLKLEQTVGGSKEPREHLSAALAKGVHDGGEE